MRNFILFFFLSFLIPATFIAQQTKIDSLLHFLKSAKEDTAKVNALNLLSKKYNNTANFKSAIHYAQLAKALAEKIQLPNQKEGWLIGIGNALSNMGNIYYNQSDYKLALDYHSRALKIREKTGNKIPIGNSYNNLGITYWKLGNNEKALESHLKSLKIMEEVGYMDGIKNSYNNIGLIYYDKKNYDQELKYYFKALKISEELGDKAFISTCYNNIGIAYKNQGIIASTKVEANNKYQQALDNQIKSLKIKEELEDKQGIGASYNNIGSIYINLGKIALNKQTSENYYKQALENYLKSLQIGKEINDKDLQSIGLNNIGSIYMMQNKLEESYASLTNALQIAKEIGTKINIKDDYAALSDLFDKKHDYKKALEYHKLYTDLKDTLLNETSGKQIAEMNTKYDTEKKDKELLQKDAEITKQQSESEKQQLQRNTFIIGFGLMLVLAFFIFRSYRQKKEANAQLEIKNEAISKQNTEIEKKNTVITDSIEYAKNIQQAILPGKEELEKHFQNYFILYKPKDIVSGDFYWIHEQEEQVLLAVADCTGHGVPGAFMSLMGHNLLKEIVTNKKVVSPSVILDELNQKILKTLKQDSKNTSAKYGMDIALICWDKKKNILEFAGAHNPLYVLRNKETIQLKADARSIGSFARDQEKGFTNQSIELQKEDMLYLFSDGYVDQIGGTENKKFFSHPFRAVLEGISSQDVISQQQLLETTITEWQGDKKQTDDMLVFGIRV
ncbi:MAG: tetratricopeptide repeat protein [Bacteroidetes bacterium]|nr:tetratricopeptide repeat protein [Bacteroidota bacterium]